MLRDVTRWFEEHRWAGDAVLAAPLMTLLGFIAVTSASYQSSVAVVFTFLLVAPLFVRRTFPIATLLVTVSVCLLQMAFMPLPVPGDVVIPIVVHAAAAYIPGRRWGLAALAAGLVGAMGAAAQWAWENLGYYRLAEWLVQAAFWALAGIAVVVAAYVLGLRQREKRAHAKEQLAALAERNRLLIAERDSRAEASGAAERARIARELHDIVAHSLSVIIVQADGGAAAARSKPELGPEVLATIAAAGRDALAQMRRMVSVLRGGTADDTTGFAPMPGPGDIDELVAQVRDTGLPVSLETFGGLRPMGSDAGLAAYRVVQESLTNVLKHAGPAAAVRVIVHYGPGEVIITVTDDGRGAASALLAAGALPAGALPAGASSDQTGYDAAPAPGHGLAGMRERVELVGGRLRSGPQTGGGFEVTAAIPYGLVAAGGTAG